MRTQRNNITLEVDSALALMQEIYNDVVENRNTASQILRKMMSFMKDAEEPKRLFDGTSDYQDRPAYSLINSLLLKISRTNEK